MNAYVVGYLIFSILFFVGIIGYAISSQAFKVLALGNGQRPV